MAGGTSAIADQEVEELDGEALLRERIMLGLRVDSGVDIDQAVADLGVVGWTKARAGAADALEKKGHLVRVGGRATFEIRLALDRRHRPRPFLKRRGTRGPSPHRPGALDGA